MPYICGMKNVILFFAFCMISYGKIYAQEVQVSFDSAGKLEVITEEIENHLQLFTNYPHFHEARLFRQNDSAYILEVSSLDDGKLTRNREPKTKQDILALQKTVAEVASERSPSILLDQSSRSKFLVWETLLSVGVYAPLFISSSSTSNPSVATGIELVVGGLGYLIPYVLTKNAPMTDGESSLALGGSFLGLGHGALLNILVTGGNPGKEVGAISALAGIAETGIGYYVARSSNMSEGTADVIRYGGLFGGLQGGALSLLINNSNPSASLTAGLSLLGSAGGFYAGSLLANDQRYSRGSASVLLTAGIFGTYITGIIYGSAVQNSEFTSGTGRGLTLSLMAGNIGGMVLAHSLMHDKHYSTSDGNDVILGTSAGWLIGTGVSYLLLSGHQNFQNLWSFSIPSVLGTAAGFAIMVNAIGKGSGDDKSTGWKMNFYPGALFGALTPANRSSANPYVPPALTVQFRW